MIINGIEVGENVKAQPLVAPDSLTETQTGVAPKKIEETGVQPEERPNRLSEIEAEVGSMLGAKPAATGTAEQTQPSVQVAEQTQPATASTVAAVPVTDVYATSEARHQNLRPISRSPRSEIVDQTIAAYDNLSDDQVLDIADQPSPDLAGAEAEAPSDASANELEPGQQAEAAEAAEAPATADDLRRDLAYSDISNTFYNRVGSAYRSGGMFRTFEDLYKDTPAYNFAKRIFSSTNKKAAPRPSARRAKNITDAEKEAQKSSFSNSGRGRRIWEKVESLPTIGVREIGVGYQEILDIIAQNPTMLKQLIRENVDLKDNPELSSEIENIGSWSLPEIVRFFREHDIFVATFKPPHNAGPDQQCRILRVMADQARGIFLHPIVAPMYTADFDGDDMSISIDPAVAKYVKDPMELLIGTDGQLTLKTDWLSVVPLIDSKDMPVRKFVRLEMLSSVSGIGDADGIDALIDAIIELGESYYGGDPAMDAAWRNLFKVAADVAGTKHPRDRRARNKLAAYIVESVASTMKQLALDRVFVGLDDSSLIDDESLPAIRTYDDRILYDVAREYVQNKAPNNAQELRVMLNSFIGHVKGKNPSFRFTADVGKMFKLDSRLRVGGDFWVIDDATGEYVLDPNNEEHLNLMHEALLKWAESEAMQKEIKKAGHSQYYSDVMKARVIKKVGFPTDKKYKGNFLGFLINFYHVYNSEAAMINMSNLVSLTTGQIAEDSVRDSVSQIVFDEKQKYPNFSDLSEPLMSIYGAYTVGRMFQPLVDSRIMAPGYIDSSWRGAGKKSSLINHKFQWSYKVDKETNQEMATRWIDGRYITYSMRQYAHDNRLIDGSYKNIGPWIKTEIDLDLGLQNMKVNGHQMNDTDVMFCMLMAVADKGTGQASTYNTQMFGVGPVNTRDLNDEELAKAAKINKQRAVDKNNTVIGRVGQLLSDINRLALQGTVLTPKYYTAIGSQETPADVLQAMEEVAATLSNDGWTARSGHTTGADQAFERGANQKIDIYVPWASYNKETRAFGKLITYDNTSGDDQRRAQMSVDKYHPAVGRLKDSTRKIHARSYFQVCGRGSEPDSAFLAYWAPTHEGKSQVTDQSIRIAKSRGIPVFNAAEYENLDDWKRDVIEAAQKAKDNKLTRLETKDQMEWINDIVEVLSHLGPDMFKYFGMDTAYGFLQSKLGMALVNNADDLEKLGGIWTSMVYEYRMSEVMALHDSLQKMIETGKANSDTLHDYEQRIEFALRDLSSSSEAWRGIIKELQAEATPGMVSVFQAKRTSGKWPLQRSPLRSYEWDPKYTQAPAFWHDMGGHETLLSVIEDLEMDRETKWGIIADVVRFWENDPNFKAWSVGFQLDIGNSAAYSMNPADKKGVLTVARDFDKSFNKWAKTNQEKLQENIDNAYKYWGDVPGSLVQTLEHLDDCPWDLVAIDSGMYADAVMASFDKTYNDTEKGQSHPWANLIYNALSSQWNGGFMNDVTRCDDRLLGITGTRTIDVHDIIHLLRDGNASLTVYNQYGQYATLTRDALLTSALGRHSTGTEQDIWQFLRLEPRIASAIRKHNACALSNSDGGGYLGARLSTAQTIRNFRSDSDPIEHVKYLMRDHPVYAALIAMSMPAKGIVARKHRQRFERTEDYVAKLIYKYAMMGDVCDSDHAARQILSELGITERSVNLALMSDYDRFLKKLGLPVYEATGGHDNSEIAQNAMFTYLVVYKNLAHYIEEVQRNVPKVKGHEVFLAPVEKPAGIKFGPDAVSVAAFWDICQELGGAKTATSTGVEGRETFDLSVWASNMQWSDRFADLQAVQGDVDEKWVGCWTNLVNANGSPVLVQYDENGLLIEIIGANGSSTEYRDLQEAALSQGLDEIVVMVPEGYTVKDKSIDNNGKPIPSLNADLMSKRSNGAETFNLQAKKAGLDGKDSIIKMRGKYRKVVQDGVERNVDFIELRDQLRSIARDRSVAADGTIDEYGLRQAELVLAKMMLDENSELGYDDMTLSNYMCLADLMLFIGDDGELYLRSLEMVLSAARYRIGADSDNMTDKEFREAIHKIVSDTSETAVGRELMDASSALDDFAPKGKAGSVNGIRTKMSVFERNYNLLDDILKNSKLDMLPEDYARKLDKVARATPGIGTGDRKNPSVLDRANIMRGYTVTRFIGSTAPVEGTTKNEYGVEKAPGFANAIVIGDGNVTAAQVADVFNTAYELGNTVIVSRAHTNLIPKKWLDDMVTCSDSGDMMIPFFDILLNGCEAEPSRGKRFNTFQAPDDSYAAFVEDPINEFWLGDSMVKILRYFADKIRVIDNGSRRITSDSLFPNVYQDERFKDCTFETSFTDGRTIANMIAHGKVLNIDYGIPTSNRDAFRQRKKDVDDAIDRYIDNIDKSNNSGFMIDTELNPGDIVAWAKIVVTHKYLKAKGSENNEPASFEVYAPIIPFQLDGVKKGVPAKYTIDQIGNESSGRDHEPGDRAWFVADWTNITPLKGHSAKIHSPSGAADKGIVNFGDVLEEARRFLDGTMVSAYIAKESISGRRTGTDRRVKTMVSAITLLRLHGFNFAESAEAFPDNPEIKERLKKEPIPASEWKRLLGWEHPLRFSSNMDVNLFLNYECQKILADGGNPSDYLANVFTDDNGVKHKTGIFWEFEAMFEPGLNYEDGLLKFMHSCDPKHCPNGIDDEGENYWFRLAKDNGGLAHGYDRGVLQMKAPFKNSGNKQGLYSGKTAYIWTTVYIGQPFFGEDFSGFSRPNIDGASIFLDATNTMGLAGVRYNERIEKQRRRWATSDQGRRPYGANAISWDDEHSDTPASDEEA